MIFDNYINRELNRLIMEELDKEIFDVKIHHLPGHHPIQILPADYPVEAEDIECEIINDKPIAL